MVVKGGLTLSLQFIIIVTEKRLLHGSVAGRDGPQRHHRPGV